MDIRQYILETYLSLVELPVAKAANFVFKNPATKAAPTYMDKLRKAQNAKAALGMKASGAL